MKAGMRTLRHLSAAVLAFTLVACTPDHPASHPLSVDGPAFDHGGGEIHAIERFGASAPYKDLQREFGFTPEAVVEKVVGYLGR